MKSFFRRKTDKEKDVSVKAGRSIVVGAKLLNVVNSVLSLILVSDH